MNVKTYLMMRIEKNLSDYFLKAKRAKRTPEMTATYIL